MGSKSLGRRVVSGVEALIIVDYMRFNSLLGEIFFSTVTFEEEDAVPSSPIDGRSIEESSICITFIESINSRPGFPEIFLTLEH